MSVTPCAGGTLLLLLVADSTSLQQSLLRLALTSLLLLLTSGFCALLRRTALPVSSAVAVVFSFHAGIALCLVFHILFPAVSCEPDEPLTLLLLTACGLAATKPPLFDWRWIPAALLIGGLREWLSTGALLGVTLCPSPVSTAFGEAVGGLPLAALVLCGFRLRPPLFGQKLPTAALPILGVISAVGAMLGIVTASLPTYYCLGGVTAVCALLVCLLPKKFAVDDWLFLCPAIVLAARNAVLWWPVILIGFGVPLCIAWLSRLHEYVRFSLPFTRQPDVPIALMIATVIRCIGTALPSVSY